MIEYMENYIEGFDCKKDDFNRFHSSEFTLKFPEALKKQL